MTASVRTTTPPTRQRLLEAAARVFAQKGLEGATTREIARQADVNEVTLFRHFHSKEKLLGAVLQREFDRPETAATRTSPASSLSRRTGGRTAPARLRADLLGFARRYEELLQRNILLIRTVLGEIHRHRAHESSVLHGIFAPLKADLVASIQAARDRRDVRSQVEPFVAADMFSSMIFFDVLKRSGRSAPAYSAEHYLKEAVELFARGIER